MSAPPSAAGLSAVVTGATGAVGRYVVCSLLQDPAWSKVVTIGRRAWTAPPDACSGAGAAIDVAAETASGRLVQHVVDMETLASQAALFNGAHASLCALGTTRKDAGSADAFRHVDLEYVTAIAHACKAAGVRHFSLVSSMNADAGSWFLYPRTKGEAENAVKAEQFASTSILRPGLLDRGDEARWVEKMAMYVMPSIPVQTVARAMVADAKAHLQAAGAGGGGAGASPLVTELSNKDLFALSG